MRLREIWAFFTISLSTLISSPWSETASNKFSREFMPIQGHLEQLLHVAPSPAVGASKNSLSGLFFIS